MIRLTVPSIEEDDLSAAREALASGFLVQGLRVAAFERAVALSTGTTQAVAVSNCTAALHLALLGLGVGPGDLVLVAAYSWVATANVVELVGAKPVFVDIDPLTFNLSPAALAATLEELAAKPEYLVRLKAIIPVHAFGAMADMPAIMALADYYEVPVIEDAACALGAALAGRPAGAWGRAGCFSFHPRKAITTGEGGVVVGNDQNLTRHIRALRNHGQDPEAVAPDFIMPGFNYRLTEFQAALGLTQLAKLERILAARRRLAAVYDQTLAGSPFMPQLQVPGSRTTYQSYVVLGPAEAIRTRDEVVRLLKEQGIETSIGTWHLPLTRYYRDRYGYGPGDFPATDRVFAQTITLPLFETFSEDVAAHVARTLINTWI